MKPYSSYAPFDAGWISSLPAHWSALQVKYVCTYNDEVLPDNTAADAQIKYVEISDVDEVNGLKGSESMAFKDAPSRARRLVRDGDIIISTVRTYLRAVAPIKNPPENLVVSTGFAVVRPEGLVPGFARYALVADGFVGSVITRSTGVSYPAINASDLVRISVPVPPIDEQHAIASYLDAETARIDGLIEEKTKLLEYLHGMRSAIIVAAMLNDSKAEQRVPYTNAPWMGSLPAGCTQMTLTRVVESACDGPFGSSLKSEHYTDEGIPVIRLQNIGDGEFLTGDPAYISEEYFRALGGHDAMPGDMVVASLGDERRSPGRACVVPRSVEQALVKADCFRFRLDPTKAMADFVAMQLNSLCRPFFQFTAKGTTRQRVTISDVRRCPIALPNINEQRRVIDQVRSEQKDVANLIEHVEKELGLLSELRSVTITDAVLGRIDVSEHMSH